MRTIDWIVIIVLVVYVGLAAFSIKFPRGRENWKKGRAETFYIALSATVFLMLLLLLWYVSAVVDWPSAITLIVWSSLFVLVMLVLVGIFVPRGIALRLPEQRKKQIEEED